MKVQFHSSSLLFNSEVDSKNYICHQVQEVQNSSGPKDNVGKY